jgi:hypothetical protein
MAAGRRTWVISVFILGTVILWVMSKRLKISTGTDKRFVGNNLDPNIAVPFGEINSKVGNNKEDTLKIFSSDLQVQIVKPDGRSGDPKSPKILSNVRETYLGEMTVPKAHAKVTKSIRVPNPTTPKVTPGVIRVQSLRQTSSESRFPSKCDYPETPAQDSFNHEPQRWQSVAQRTIMVFSAYLDSRKEIGGPFIRVLASGKQTRFGHSGVVSCVLWLKEGSRIIGVPTEASYDVIYESRLHPSMYTAHYIFCKMRTISNGAESILGVSVVPKPCGIKSNVLKLARSKPFRAKNNTFSMCLSPIYGNYDNAPAIIEHFEMHKILGVEKITVYILSVGPTVGSIIQKYQSEGLVEIVNWKYPYSNVLCDYFAQREALNDCLYRNMGRTRFLALVDLDEIITPRKTLVWDAMMSRIYKPERGAYLFQHAYFLSKQPKSSKPRLLTQAVFSRPNEVYPPGKIRCKSIYEMEKTVQVNIHFPYALLPGFKEYIVPSEEAILHHYRNEVMQIFYDGTKTFTYIEDTYMINYSNRIRKAFAHRLRQFNIV